MILPPSRPNARTPRYFYVVISCVLIFFGEFVLSGIHFAATQEVLLKHLLSKFWSDESGATAIEYGLIAAGIALAIITAVNQLGTTLNTKFTSVNSSIK
jgi:pilus assembly protein Flp/PilA